MCKDCHGLIMSPNKPYDYTGPTCYCMLKEARRTDLSKIDYDRIREIIREELYPIKKDGKMKNFLYIFKIWCAAMGALVGVLLLIFGSFFLSRWVNYTFGYEGKVQHEIREMVKKECLR